MTDLHELEAVKLLKYRYFRLLDCKAWEEMAELFVEDASVSYDNGKYAFQGRSAIMEFLSGSLGDREIISMHLGHHPEIRITGPAAAEATWYFEDYVIFENAGFRLRGAGFYRDRYVKVDQAWKIAETGYVRTFEEMQSADQGPGWKLTHYGDQLGD